MTPATIVEVIDRLIGPVSPVGETHIDKCREQNLKVMIAVATALCEGIKRTAEYRNDYRHSVKTIGQRAQASCDELEEMLGETDGEDEK